MYKKQTKTQRAGATPTEPAKMKAENETAKDRLKKRQTLPLLGGASARAKRVELLAMTSTTSGFPSFPRLTRVR